MNLSNLAARRLPRLEPEPGRLTNLAEVMLALQDLGNDDETIVTAVRGMLQSGALRRPATRH